MHIGEIYIQDNFVPDIVTDQFRRKVIGVKVLLKEGEGTAEAEAFGEAYIAEYIAKNTANPHVSGVSMVADNVPVPEVQIIRPESEIEIAVREINECTDMLTLKTYWLPSKSNLALKEAYKAKEKQLQKL